MMEHATRVSFLAFSSETHLPAQPAELLAVLSPANLSSSEDFRCMLKWWCLNKKRLLNFPPVTWKHNGCTYIKYILTNVQVMFTSWNYLTLMCGYFALWYLIKTLTWVQGCWFKTSLRSTKINCCMFVLLVAVEASYFLWTSLDVLALEVQL